ncbi:MAG: haloalkane dehalogenase, partial [Planctomycetota bacterium]
IVTWANTDGLTEEEFDAIELPQGWFKNQPREIVFDEGTFASTPGSATGEFVDEELFGHSWRHVATVTEANVLLDSDGLLTANTISKSHEVTFDAGTTLPVLQSPSGEQFALVTRDANRTSDTPTLPEGWQVVDRAITEELVLQLPNPTTNIRADNQDSFQGPVVFSDDGGGDHDDGCGADPIIMTTSDGTEFVRTPDECFANLPDWPYQPHYVEIDGLRQAYVDEGPADGPVVLLLHGQPSWSYLYRDMIPVLSDAGYRVIAMDHLGMGRSDKPIDIERYSYLDHNERLEEFITELGLMDINLFAQDWGSLIGLRVAGLNPDWFSTITIGNGSLPVWPAGETVFPPVENSEAIVDIPSPYSQFPDQQIPFYDGCERLELPADGGQGQGGLNVDNYFGYWMRYAMTGASFQPSETLEALTWYDLSPEEEAAYDAPFPSRTYMAGPRVFPSLVNEVPGTTQQAWMGLRSFDSPFLTIWAANDPGQQGTCEAQQFLVDNVAGANGQPHTRIPESSHFLQDDQGVEIASQLVAFYQANGILGATSDADAELLSAYLGALDIPLERPLEAITGADHEPDDDGMPVVFSVQIDADTLSPQDFQVTTASGATMTPTVATLAPADEADELRTVLLAGPLGTTNDPPISVSVIDSLESIDGVQLRGLTSEITTNEHGAELVVAVVDPAEMAAEGNEVSPARVQTTWQGGVSAKFGRTPGQRELQSIHLVDQNGDRHHPVGFEDVADDDNHIVLIAPEGVTPVRVDVEAGTFFDPTNRPNPETSIEISDIAELENEASIPERGNVGPIRRALSQRDGVIVDAVHARRAIHRLQDALTKHRGDEGNAANGPQARLGQGRLGERLRDGLLPTAVDAVLQPDQLPDFSEMLTSRLGDELSTHLAQRIGRH